MSSNITGNPLVTKPHGVVRIGGDPIGGSGPSQDAVSGDPATAGQFHESATYMSNLCPIHCGGAAGHSRPRTTILHSEGGHCEGFLGELVSKLREPVQKGLRGYLLGDSSNEKKK